MRYAPFAILLVACGDPGGAAGSDSGCPPTIDGGTLLGSSSRSCTYACTSDATAGCTVIEDSGFITNVCTLLTIDPLNCGRCGHSCNGGTCVAGVCR